MTGQPAFTEAMESLRLPAPFDEATHRIALDIHAFLKQQERPPSTLDAKLAAHREAALSQLLTLQGKRTFPPPVHELHWPDSLYIPKSANAFDYFPAPAPDNHRYVQVFTTSTANKASLEDGSLYCFGQLDNTVPSKTQISESGVGIFYQSAFNLGVIEVQPHVDCAGTLRTFLEFFPEVAAGYVQVVAQLNIGAYERRPSGLVMVGFAAFDVATLRRDQSSGPEEDNFQSSVHGPSLSLTVEVAGGSMGGGFSYLIGVWNRILITSYLTTTNGQPLPPIDNSKLKVWGVMTCRVKEIDVTTKQIIDP